MLHLFDGVRRCLAVVRTLRQPVEVDARVVVGTDALPLGACGHVEWNILADHVQQ